MLPTIFFYILLDNFPIFFLKIWSDINYDYVILYIAIVHVFHHKLWLTLIFFGIYDNHLSLLFKKQNF